MAEKEVSIHLKTQGAAAAAAEVKSVDEAVKQLDASAEAVGEAMESTATETKRADAALKQLDTTAAATAESMASLGESTGAASASGGGSASGGRRRGGSKKGAAAAMKELTEEAPKAGSAASKVGQIATAAGFQVQDFAVQVGGGTSALTAFAQQGSQLLGIFGPQGAIAGAVLALGAVAYKVFSEMAEAPKEAVESMADIEEKLKKLKEARLESSAESGAEGVRKWIEVFDKEAEAIERANRNLAANIELIRAKRRADAEIASAEDALELAHIDANPTMSEEDKIRARADVKRRGDRRKAEADLKELNLQNQESRQTAAEAAAASKKANEETAAISAEIARGKQEAARLKAQVGRANIGRASLPGAEQSVTEAEKKLQTLRSDREASIGPFGDTHTGPTEAEVQRAAEEVREAQEALEEARRAATSANGGDRRRLAELEGRGDKAGRLGELQKQLEVAEEAAAKAQQAANDAARKRDEDRKKTAEAARSVVGRYQIGLQTTEISTEASATEARQKAEEKAKKEQEQNDRTALRDQIANEEAALDASAEDASGKFGEVARRGNRVGGKQGDRLVKTLDSISQRLGDGTTESELARIGKQFEDATRGVGGQTIELLRNMITEQQRLAGEISAMKSRYQRGPSSDR